jgi:hypothetical protein
LFAWVPSRSRLPSSRSSARATQARLTDALGALAAHLDARRMLEAIEALDADRSGHRGSRYADAG